MRAAPLLFFVVLLVGCGRGSAEYAAKKSFQSDGMAATTKAPMTASAAVAAPMFGRASMRDAAGEAPMFAKASVRDAAAGAAEAQAQTAAYATPVAPPRMIVRNGSLSLRVKDIKAAEAQVRAIARGAGGTVEASEGSDLAGPSPNLGVTIRVPESRFDGALTDLEGLGDRLEKNISSEDVTSQAVDMEARIKSLRVQEDAYRAILGATRRISDVLEVQERLTGVRTQIEQIVAQRRGLGDQAARSTIVVSLTQTAPIATKAAPPVEPNWLALTWGDATGSLFSVGRALASTLLWLAVMSPVWAPLGLVGLVVYRRTRFTQAA